jgi:hypothetical protein
LIVFAVRRFAGESEAKSTAAKNVLSEEDKAQSQEPAEGEGQGPVVVDSDGKVVVDGEALFDDAKGEEEAEAENEAKFVPPPSTEVRTGAVHKREFQAETSRILDIMANSLYTDKEVWLLCACDSTVCCVTWWCLL